MKSLFENKKRHVCRRRRAAKVSGTLIELLLVLVILATLAAVVTPKFTRRSEQARITAAKTQISQFEEALSAFMKRIHKNAPGRTRTCNLRIRSPRCRL